MNTLFFRLTFSVLISLFLSAPARAQVDVYVMLFPSGIYNSGIIDHIEISVFDRTSSKGLRFDQWTGIYQITQYGLDILKKGALAAYGFEQEGSIEDFRKLHEKNQVLKSDILWNNCADGVQVLFPDQIAETKHFYSCDYAVCIVYTPGCCCISVPSKVFKRIYWATDVSERIFYTKNTQLFARPVDLCCAFRGLISLFEIDLDRQIGPYQFRNGAPKNVEKSETEEALLAEVL